MPDAPGAPSAGWGTRDWDDTFADFRRRVLMESIASLGGAQPPPADLRRLSEEQLIELELELLRQLEHEHSGKRRRHCQE